MKTKPVVDEMGDRQKLYFQSVRKQVLLSLMAL